MSIETIEAAIQQIVDADYLGTDGIDVKVYKEDYEGVVDVITNYNGLLTPTEILPSSDNTPARRALEDAETLMRALLEDGYVVHGVHSEYSRQYYRYRADFHKEGNNRAIGITLSTAAINNVTDLIAYVIENLNACGFTANDLNDTEGETIVISKPVEIDGVFQQQTVGYVISHTLAEADLGDSVLGNNPENPDESEALFTSHAHRALSRAGAVLAKCMKLTTGDRTQHARVYRYKDRAYAVHSL